VAGLIRLAGLTGLITRIARDWRTGHQDRSRLAGLITGSLETDGTGHSWQDWSPGSLETGRTDHSWQNWSRLAGLGHQDRSRLAGLVTAGRTDRTGHQDRSRLTGLVTSGRTDHGWQN
jgi:hypothetical protein